MLSLRSSDQRQPATSTTKVYLVIYISVQRHLLTFINNSLSLHVSNYYILV
jgi:hypothetical protein